MLKAVNISTIPQRSPFRYPGGKTWLIPQVRSWLLVRAGKGIRLIEPFAGGGIVTLTAVMEGFVDGATMVELDQDVAAVWRAILGRNSRSLAKNVKDFDFTTENVKSVLEKKPITLKEQAFQTLLKNRVKRNGILAAGAGLLKNGESGYGLSSRWYPNTLSNRILEIAKVKDKIIIEQGDGLAYLKKSRKKTRLIFFLDPPYNHIGKRLYSHGQIDHEALFQAAARLQGDFMMTYNRTDEVLELAEKYQFQSEEIVMNGGVTNTKVELILGRDLSWI